MNIALHPPETEESIAHSAEDVSNKRVTKLTGILIDLQGGRNYGISST